MMSDSELIIDQLKDFIKSDDKDSTLKLMAEMQQDCLGEGDLFLVVTHPPVITELHRLLIDHMGVHPKAMMLKRRIDNRKKRAYLFMQAMINGVNIVNERTVQ